MEPSTYDFRVGDIRCTALSDGTFTYGPPIFPPPAGMFFANAPLPGLTDALAAHGIEAECWESLTTCYTCLLVQSGGRVVLVDTGAGALGPDTGKLLDSLGLAGIGPEHVERVILTHGHPDHLGGNTDAHGELVFPNARWVVAQPEWDFWTGVAAEREVPEHSRDILVGTARRNLSPLQDRVDLVSGEKEIVPGVYVIPAPGHTPGHLAVRVSSASEDLLCVADLVLHPVHVQEPEWIAVVDMLPDRLVETRRQILGAASANKSLVMAFHFPFPGLGRVIPSGAAWRWEAVLRDSGT
jgi:glyoxylase-like metal-dependent hydrolase (beta-lactamase superfamily II)